MGVQYEFVFALPQFTQKQVYGMNVCIRKLLLVTAVIVSGTLLILSTYRQPLVHVRLDYAHFIGDHIPSVTQSAVIPASIMESIHPRSNTTFKPKPKPKPKKEGVRCNLGSVPLKEFEVYTERALPDVTVTTAYFNLGKFRKASAYFHTEMYMQWAKIYKYIRNPFVFYTDSTEIANTFSALRKGLENTTKIVLVKREEVNAFKLLNRIKKIYSTPGYPKHYPNTVLAEYSCAQHAKYDLVDESVKHNYFNTKYHTWIDIGYFRYIVKRQNPFVIVKPLHFNDSRIAMNRVYSLRKDLKPERIFKGNSVSIGGGMFFGTKFTLPLFIEDYRSAVERYLNLSLSNTDQQVLYAMNTKTERSVLRHRVDIQEYVYNISGDCWFFLGYSCYKELRSKTANRT